MLRTQISLTEDERRILDAVAARTGRSIAGLIRDAVHIVYGDERSVEDDLVALRTSSGAWRGRELSAEEEVDLLRSGRRLNSFP